jgi:hypothetical protein
MVQEMVSLRERERRKREKECKRYRAGEKKRREKR